MHPGVEDARDGSGTGGSVGVWPRAGSKAMPMASGLEAAQNYPLPPSPLLSGVVPSTAPVSALEPDWRGPSADTNNRTSAPVDLVAPQRTYGNDVGTPCATTREVPSAAVDASLNRRAMSSSLAIPASQHQHELSHPAPSLDLDVTVMAYAQWLTEIKHQATNVRFQQKAELELMREAIGASCGELAEFKRHCGGIVQQLQNQVGELRSRLNDVIEEAAANTKQRLEYEQYHRGVIGGLQESLHARNNELDTGHRSLAESFEQLRSEVHDVTQEIGNVRKAISGSQEQTVLKFGEVDQALNVFRNGFENIKAELGDTRQDWKKGQDLLGQAISTLSQDLSDFQKHTSTVTKKIQSDVYHVEEASREERDRTKRAEAQLAGLQQNLYDNTNEMILMRSERDADKAGLLGGSVPLDSAGAVGFGSGSVPPAGPLRHRSSASSVDGAPPRSGGATPSAGSGMPFPGGGAAFPNAGVPERNSGVSRQSKTALESHGAGKSAIALDVEAFGRPLSPQQDPRLARSVQKRFANASSPMLAGPPVVMGHVQSQPMQGHYSRSPSPSHGQVILH